jgi:hypothetical protein
MYRAGKQVVVLSATLMEDVFSLEFGNKQPTNNKTIKHKQTIVTGNTNKITRAKMKMSLDRTEPNRTEPNRTEPNQRTELDRQVSSSIY